MNTSIIFSCLRARVDTFSELRNELKQKTIHDEEIDNAWNEYDDWPAE